MLPKIKSGQLCTVSRVNPGMLLQEGDIVLCRVKGKQYLHLIKAVKQMKSLPPRNTYQIGNNRGGINGWTNIIYGILVKVED